MQFTKVVDSNIDYKIIRSTDNVPLYHFLTTSMEEIALRPIVIDVTSSVCLVRISINCIIRHG